MADSQIQSPDSSGKIKATIATANAALKKTSAMKPTKTSDLDEDFNRFRIDAKVGFPQATAKERTDYHREVGQLILDTTEEAGIEVWFRPLLNLKGPRTRYMTPRIRFEGAEEKVGALGIYSNEWASKADQKYLKSSVSFGIEVKATMTEWYGKVIIIITSMTIALIVLPPKRDRLLLDNIRFLVAG